MLSGTINHFVVVGHLFACFSVVFCGEVCYNCGIGSECGGGFQTTPNIALDTDCWQLCNNSGSCNVATLNSSSICALYTCRKISQKIGGKAYRKTLNTDCEEFEIYVHKGFAANCVKCAPDSSSISPESCLQQCLDTPLCRATSFYANTSTCEYFTNPCLINGIGTDLVATAGKTLLERRCLNEEPPCIRQFTQTCVNCKAGASCQKHFSQVSNKKPLSISTSVIGTNANVQQIWYTTAGSNYKYIQCTYVTQAIGDQVYRATCTQDCPKFEILTLPGYRGTCPIVNTLVGGATLEYCVSQCLDMINCRGVTFDKRLTSCMFHSCTSYKESTGFDFVARRCLIDPECGESTKVTQTCLGCTPGPNCPLMYLNKYSQSLTSDCMDVKATEDPDSVIVHYKRRNSKCSSYQCSQVQQTDVDIVYRESCNSDCQKFEIFQLDDIAGSCDVIYSEKGGLNFYYCIEKCLDLSGCRGTTFNSTSGRCDYHSCENRTSSPGLKFMWKRCIDIEPPRTTLQTCLHCSTSIYCQNIPHTFANFPMWQSCKTYYENSIINGTVAYNGINGKCELRDCTMVKPNHNKISYFVFRRSPSTDCPIFKLLYLKVNIGTCPSIGFDEGRVTLDYCVDKCLDMPGCRGVSQDTSKMNCSYHNCSDREADTSHTFVERECLTDEDLNPVKPYTQTCKNCNIGCQKPLSIQTNIQISAHCNTTCVDCDNVFYNPHTEECKQFQCDQPVAFGTGSTLLRKTDNPECQHFELFLSLNSVPSCEPFDYDEGVSINDWTHCIVRCLDMPFCRKTFLDPSKNNCTYYTCMKDIPVNMNTLHYTKKCYTECASPVTQTCLNCREDTSMCPSFFFNVSTFDSSSCKGLCESETFCKSAVYDSSGMECQLFECAYTKQHYGSILHRTSCNNDCQRYEIYILEGYTGTCDVIEEMNGTQHLIINPEICYDICLDTPGCRGVTYNQSKYTCKYHSCNCHQPKAGERFMWKYCLDEDSIATVLPQTLNPMDYPTSAECRPKPIYIMPCACSSGVFGNMTTEEIAQQLVTNLTIDAKTTSTNIRKLTSAGDNRPVSVAVGSVGVAVLACIAAAIIVADVANLVRALIQLKIGIQKIVKSKKPDQSGPNTCADDTAGQSIELTDNMDIEDITSVSETVTETTSIE